MVCGILELQDWLENSRLDIDKSTSTLDILVFALNLNSD